MQDKYFCVNRIPTLEEYMFLRESVGWEKVDPLSTLEGLINSLFSICVMYKNSIIGLGRVVGDGGIYFFIQDVIVVPEFKGEGIEKYIMDAIMDFLREKASPSAFIGLMAPEVSSGFCERYGFTNSITGPAVYSR